MTDKDKLGQLCKDAAALARFYNWPDEAEQLEKGRIPEDFPKEVGSTIALFLKPLVIGWSGTRNGETYEEHVANSRQHARKLAGLRMLLAQIAILERVMEHG